MEREGSGVIRIGLSKVVIAVCADNPNALSTIHGVINCMSTQAHVSKPIRDDLDNDTIGSTLCIGVYSLHTH